VTITGKRNFLKCDKNFTDTRIMKIGGLTIQEIADALEIPYRTAQKRLKRAGIKPITTGAIYPKEAVEALKKVSGPGRPRKDPEVPAKEIGQNDG
jgi:hypothetical protein